MYAPYHMYTSRDLYILTTAKVQGVILRNRRATSDFKC